MRYVGYFFAGLGMLLGILCCAWTIVFVVIWGSTSGQTHIPNWAMIIALLPLGVVVVGLLTIWGEEIVHGS